MPESALTQQQIVSCIPKSVLTMLVLQRNVNNDLKSFFFLLSSSFNKDDTWSVTIKVNKLTQELMQYDPH